MTEETATTAHRYPKGVLDVAIGRSDGGEEIRRTAQLDDLELVRKTFLHRPYQLLVPKRLAADVKKRLSSLDGDWKLHPRDSGHLLLRLEDYADDADLLPATAPTLDAAGKLRRGLGADSGIAVNAILCSAALQFYSAPKYQGKDAIPQPVAPPALDQRPDLDHRGQRPVVCGIVDTGLARQVDPWLEDAVERGQVVLDPYDEREKPDALAPYDELDPVAGHGTFIAGQVLWEAPAATVYLVRQGGAAGVVDEDSLLAAIDRLVKLAGGHLDILNLSLGGWTEDDKEPPLLAARLRELIDGGTVVVAAAGNLESPRPFWPAAMREVVGVAALTTAGKLAAWSNRGKWVDVVTRGEQIESTFFDAYSTRDPAHPNAERLEFRGWGTWAGSSFSGPRVVAAVARRLAQHPKLTPRKALHQIADEQRTHSQRLRGVEKAWTLP